ncbi:YihY/virulence factor BrkB family protein [Sphingomonas sp. SUN039]|uniref:YihY/virulence factor BrkB family protein n=1 Tax=Sphingomonas sp. SUN039 TaxID=2937787 RepID=UPI0021646D7C|nr:YihY/virulence factor BrkB family protein [Sphingomonas sp. SUN039]UVO55622.1 YihY/virulence factor BrkB family protein [Sphingomonas sp. SUN039]
MQEAPSPQSPAERDKHLAQGDRTTIAHRLDHLPVVARAFEVVKRVVVGVFNDGFIHAGNLAYLTLLTLFPFFIVTAALASLFGRSEDTINAVNSVFVTLPASTQEVLRQPIHDVLTERTGALLWIGALIGLWTVGSFIETIRDILRRAYGTRSSAPFWQYRLRAIGLIIAAVVAMMAAFSLQVFLTAAEQFVFRLFPFADNVMGWIQLSRLVPLFVAWGAVYLIMWTLTPGQYRMSRNPKWPGALLVALWWYGALALLPVVIARLSNYDLTYGSLAGVIITLIFFWFVGLGFTVGAHLNAALSEPPEPALQALPKE